MSSTTTPIATHTEDALSRLLTQYAQKTLVTGLMTALLSDVQSIEDAYNGIAPSRVLANASGQPLDDIGSLVNVARNGLPDTTYRSLIYAAIGENYSDGTMPTLLHILQLIFQTSTVQVCSSLSPGSAQDAITARTTLGFGLGNPQLDPNYYSTVIVSFLKATPAAVDVYAIWTFNTADAFTMAGPQSWAVSGYGDLNNPAAGGGLGKLIYSNASL